MRGYIAEQLRAKPLEMTDDLVRNRIVVSV